MLLHADAIAEDRAAVQRTRRIDRDNTDGLALRPQQLCIRIHQRALACARRPGESNADALRVPAHRMRCAQHRCGGSAALFHKGDGTRQRTHIADAHPL